MRTIFFQNFSKISWIENYTLKSYPIFPNFPDFFGKLRVIFKMIFALFRISSNFFEIFSLKIMQI